MDSFLSLVSHLAGVLENTAWSVYSTRPRKAGGNSICILTHIYTIIPVSMICVHVEVAVFIPIDLWVSAKIMVLKEI